MPSFIWNAEIGQWLFFQDPSVSMDHSLRWSLEVSQSVICKAGVKRVEGGGYVTLIPSLSRPAMQVTESNKGVSCVVMLQGPVKGEVRWENNVVNVFNKLDKYNITGKTHYNLWQGNIQYDREKGTKGQLILVWQQELNMIIRQYLSISWSNSENKVLLQN